MGYVAANGLLLPQPPMFTWGATSTDAVIDATGEKIAMVGRVWNKDHATKSIERVGFLFGNSLTKAGGSALTVSLQDVSLTSGPPMQPDETQDQTVAIANADASFAADTWYRTGTLSANRSVAFGERLAVVIEFDGGGRLGADSIEIRGRTAVSSRFPGTDCAFVGKTGGAWAALGTVVPIVLLEFSDGTFGTLDGALPHSDATTEAFNSGSTPDERGNAFTVPFPCKVDGLWCAVTVAASADFDMVLYEGSTALATASIDANAIEATGAAKWLMVPITETALKPGTTYRVVAKPTTANNVSVYNITVNAAGHFDCWSGGQSISYTSRVDAGAFSDTTTQRITMGVRLSAINNKAAMLVNNAGLVG